MKLTWASAAAGVPDGLAAIEAELLAPGAPFELEDAIVLGEPMKVMARRPRSLRELLLASARFGDAEYLMFAGPDGERRFSYAEHLQRVAATAAALRDRFGVRRGDRVAIAAANTPEWIVAFWATVSLGGVAVGLNAWWTGSELRYAVDDAAPAVIIADARRAERLGACAAPVVVMEQGFDALWSAGSAALPDAAIAEDDPAVILYTSGTTGRPKGAVHSHRNLIALIGLNGFHGLRLARQGGASAGGAPPCVMVTSPLFHVSGLHSAAVSALAGGVRTVWLQGRFDAARAVALMAREGVTAWGYTSALLHRLVEHLAATGTRPGLQQLGGGGSPIAPPLQARAREVLPGIAERFAVGYGLTECTALATLNVGDELRAFPRSVGRPMPTVEIEIRDAAGAPLAAGEVGEVCVRGPLVMLGYWRNPAATEQAIGPGRWLRTGDLGRIEDGRLHLSSRRRDLILRGGENVYPVEIEQRLEQHPDVAEAAVVGVPHPELGQEVKAIVVPRRGAGLDVTCLAAWVAEALAYFKVPAHWDLRAEPLPRNATGKVLKHVLAGDIADFVDEE